MSARDGSASGVRARGLSREYQCWLGYQGKQYERRDVLIEEGRITEMRDMLGEVVPMTVRVELPRPLRERETLELSISYANDEPLRTTFPERLPDMCELPFFVPRSARELCVRTTSGLIGTLIVDAGDIAPGGELLVKLAPESGERSGVPDEALR